MEQALLVVFDEVVEYLLEVFGMAGEKGQAGQGDKSLAKEPRVHPGIAGIDFLATVVAGDESVGAGQKRVVAVDLFVLELVLRVIVFLEVLGVVFCSGGRDYYGLACLKVDAEYARRKEIFFAVESTAVFVGIGYAVIPYRVGAEFGRL